MSQEPSAILSGIKILSVTQFLVGPAAVQYLSDLGADVIKIESPGKGAWERTWAGGDTFPNGVSAFYLLSHRNVRSLTLNLKHPEGQAVAKRLAAEVDVLVENFRPGVMEKFGLGYEEVRQVNPSIIYASASGFGQDGPYRHLPGQDLLVQAVSGMASVTGRAGEPPTAAGAAIVDQHCAALLAMAVAAALFHRQRTGEGRRIEATLLESALDLQLEPIVYHLNGGIVQRPRGPLASSFHPAPYGIYKTRDGYLALSLSPIRAIGEALGSPPELEPFEDPKLAMEKREEIAEALAPFFPARDTGEWVELLRAHNVWCAPVNDYVRMLEDPGVEHLDPFLEMEHPQAGRVRVLKHPVRYGGSRPSLRRLPPALGEDTQEVLQQLGYEGNEMARLRDQGVV